MQMTTRNVLYFLFPLQARKFVLVRIVCSGTNLPPLMFVWVQIDNHDNVTNKTAQKH